METNVKERNRWSWKQLKRGWKEVKPGHWVCECDRFVLDVVPHVDAFIWSVFDPLGSGGRATPVKAAIAVALEGAKLAAQRAARELGQ